MIVDDILREFYLSIAKNFGGTISDYGVGVRYAYCVVSHDKKSELGLALTMTPDIYQERFAAKPTRENLLEDFMEGGILTRTLALACINAISQYVFWNYNNHREATVMRGNLIELLADRIYEDSRIVVIGNMRPLVKRLREITHHVWVFERDPYLRGDALPDYFEYRYLQKADTIIVTGCTLINDTIDPILRYSPPNATKVIVGPTAQLYPKILLKYFDIVASMRIIDIGRAVDLIKRGGGRWAITKFAEEYIILKNNERTADFQ